jgi:predicted nucleotidyltransferase
MAMNARLKLDEATLARFCTRHRIRRLALFGSVLGGTDRPDSDVDLLVEFEPGQEPGLLALAGMEAELSARRGGLGGAASDTGRFRQLPSLSLLQPGPFENASRRRRDARVRLRTDLCADVIHSFRNGIGVVSCHVFRHRRGA